ncbi:MAG: glucan 1,4-alpha-glucosidase [Deltaproteobacteria bacterium]|nr:glucan 1,4-alpha-glucosidase [Deltaproteobacteria bacterium]
MSVAFKEEFPYPSPEPFGKPGVTPNWSRASKQGIGTSIGDASKVWFTIADGVITEVYYPTIDTANVRDLKFLITDSKTFFDEEGVDTASTIEYIDAKAPAWHIINTAKSGNYRIIKRVFTDPASNSLIISTQFEALKGKVGDYKLYVLFAPHIKNRGYENSGRCADYEGRSFMFARREDITAALTCDVPFTRMSAGYSGYSDGWHDLKDNNNMDWSFQRAEEGNVALIGEIPIDRFNLVLSFGRDEVEAALDSELALSRDIKEIEREYIRGWKRYINSLENLGRVAEDRGRRFLASSIVLKTHEDKTYKGGLIASLSIPWGEVKGDTDGTGYHLVWARDLVKAAFGFMAMGDEKTPSDILRFLLNTQNQDGSWPQNMWINGKPNWEYVQLDEVALPIMLAWRLKGMGVAGHEFYPMVKKAAGYLVRNGPVTEQERWEENMGFSPSTLAAEVSSLICAANWALEMGEEADAQVLFTTADAWNSRIEEWTFTECDCIGENIPGHYLRIVQQVSESLTPSEQLCHALVFNRNRPHDMPHHQGELVDAGFLDLVRFGLRSPKDPRIMSSIEVVDKLLRFEGDNKVAFYRFNGDGYGETEDGSPFRDSGAGRPWPLITGERAMYELMAGRDPFIYLKSFEEFANEGLMFPEQVWDRDDIPEKRLYKGKGTGSATPLMWAHSEYIKLLRSVKDNKGCDLIDEVKKRYVDLGIEFRMAEWKKDKPITIARSTEIVRIISFEKANIVWTNDNWQTKSEDTMVETGLGLHYIDFKPGSLKSESSLIFTLYFPNTGKWEGKDYAIRIF